MVVPKIDGYQFGTIKIDGVEYHKDVIILPDRVISGWWRKSGHNLHQDDLTEVLDNPPEILIIGRGSASRMQVPEQTLHAIKSVGIDVRALPTKQACSLYNELREQCRVAAALHLTC